MTQNPIAAILPRDLFPGVVFGSRLEPGKLGVFLQISLFFNFLYKELGVTERYQVLVIDGLEDTGEVLKAILEPRGLLVEQVRSLDLLPQKPNRQTPRLIVFHSEDFAAMKTSGRWEKIPQIVIGSIPEECSQEIASDESQGDHCYLSKPFEFRDLLSAIEDCLQHCEIHSEMLDEKIPNAA